MTYDANGNLTNDGTRALEWDARDRLLAIVDGIHRSEFRYDGFSRRVEIIEKSAGITVSDLFYIWCGSDICEERDASNLPLKRFEAQGVYEGASKLFYGQDHLGSVVTLTDVASDVRASYTYDLVGRLSKLSGDKESEVGYAGLLTHSASSLALAQYRAYSPESGRWISQNPLGYIDGPNRYSYAVNNSVVHRDPSGLTVWNYTPSPILVKPEDGEIGLLLPGQQWPGSPDGVANYPFDGTWQKVRGKSLLPDNQVEVDDHSVKCIGGWCSLPTQGPKTVRPPDPTWIPPANPASLTNTSPIPLALLFNRLPKCGG